MVAQFAQAHPDVALDITLDHTVLDPVAARVDLAIRIGDSGDDPRLARKLFETRDVVCCGPEQAKLIKDVQDLNGILWLRTPTMPRKMPLYAEDGRETVIAPSRQLVVNSAPMIWAVLAEGDGFAIFPEFSVRDALADKTLCNPLPEFGTATVTAYAFFTERRTELTNARAFVDALVKGLVQGAYLPYKTAFNLGKEMVDGKAAKRALAKWMALHPTNVTQKVQFIMEHFSKNVAHLLDGKAKAIVVTSSRAAAVR